MCGVALGFRDEKSYSYDEYGEPYQTVPKKVLDGVAAVACGGGYTAAIKTDGSLWMWGDNFCGQLGFSGGNNLGGIKDPCQTVPKKVLDGVAAVACGRAHTAAIKTDGSLWMWGSNYSGELGFEGGNRKDELGRLNQTVPKKVMDSVAAVSCGYDHTAAVKTDGGLWTWGTNGSGQLGNGTTDDRSTPAKVMDNAAAVSCSHHTAAIKTDGSLWTWGWNEYGQLGFDGGNSENKDGSLIQALPKQVSGMAIRAAATPTPAASTKPVVVPTAQNLTVNGEAKDTEIYNIDGSNYFKLRDVAALLNGTASRFSVDWDAASKTIAARTGEAYTSVGGELQIGTDKSASAVLSPQKLTVNGKAVELVAYNIGGNNFFKLRDLGEALNFNVDWDAASKTMVVTSK